MIGMKRSNIGSDHIKVLIDRTLMVDGVSQYNAVPRKIREYDSSFLGFKNCIDKWLNEVPDKPRDVGFEPEARSIEGKPSNSLKDLAKVITYDDSWVPVKKVKKK